MLIQEALYPPTRSQSEAYNWAVKLIFATFVAILPEEISLTGFPDKDDGSKLIQDIKMDLLNDRKYSVQII
jgi:hypothetical protein